jgi:hypothetical protein
MWIWLYPKAESFLHDWILIRSRRNPNFLIQENWMIQFDFGGLKSVPCARLFAANYS